MDETTSSPLHTYDPIPDELEPQRKHALNIKPFLFLGTAITLLVLTVIFLPQYLNNTTTLTPTPIPNVDRIISNGTIVIGTDATYPPMESLDDNDNLVGYDIDLGKKIAETLGVTATFKNIEWDSLFTALENGEVDVVISAVTINDERKLLYSFSDAYLNAGQVIITQKSNTTISNVTDLNGKKIAVQKGTTNETEAKKYTSEDLVMSYDNFEDATTALVNGQVDSIFSDLTNAKGILQDNPTLKIVSSPFTNDFYGIVIRSNETDLTTRINEALNSLRQQGFLVFLQQKWLE
ncbi:basic amino acid ABC transporter substrate-binding protein [candidate division WWE3 bacterium CG_4_10_14_0_2_um_filter_41_14]|uniref:Basic amino acid ABC transporter substrate-binding protein n=1 Tax=candidate division WWE3 bacterium CG_4_10_14_0_2_um_filter_41_14 TaxID=1975072 RepID=A0A2M7TH54_UNCKA|nr:MAG: basic amino acid ABC transporter substrate-binding protein [candidate division WWE3 bacterium CG_4_10_14_0_2_um_filter_41_14]